MGLMIHNLDVLSSKAERDYFIYLLDYGWDEPVVNILHRNFKKIAGWASRNNAAIITGVGEIGHFDNQVLSYHSINGKNAQDILPAILITKTNPHKFKKYSDIVREGFDKDFNCIIIPLKKIGANEENVLSIIEGIAKDIEGKKELADFKVNDLLKPNLAKALAEATILEPNVSGIGFSINKFVAAMRGKRL